MTRNDLDLARLERLWANTTAGPWTASHDDPDADGSSYVDAPDTCVAYDLEPDDADFIAAAWEALPDLIAEIRKYRNLSASQRVQWAVDGPA